MTGLEIGLAVIIILLLCVALDYRSDLRRATGQKGWLEDRFDEHFLKVEALQAEIPFL